MEDIRLPSKYMCTGCGACANVCPQNAIVMKDDCEGFLQPRINNEVCAECGLCSEICPVLNTKDPDVSEDGSSECYAAYSNDESVLMQSSSGGIFTHLAECVLSEKGIVFGAAFAEKFTVVHCSVENIDELYKLQGSKYVQSEIGDTYRKIKTALDSKRKVLFTGTPCQCAGLRSFLGREYKDLIICDLICHGVNSPSVYLKYLNELEKKYNSKTEKVSFRNKTSGWKKFSVRIDFENGESYLSEFENDPFMLGFVKSKGGFYLRESCFNCKFKGLDRGWSDITLGDCWGIEKINNGFLNENGVSLVMINTGKGRNTFQKIIPRLSVCAVSANDAVRYNIHAVKSALRNSRRDTFFREIETDGFLLDELITKYLSE